jgi:hypothetical protein
VADQIITIRVKEYAAVTLAPGNVALGEKMIVLTWTQVEKEWPDNLTVDDIDVEMSDAEGDPDPEV